MCKLDRWGRKASVSANSTEEFSADQLTDDKRAESNLHESQEFLSQAAYENVKAEDYFNIVVKVETEVYAKEIDELIENHQQGKEEKADGKEEDEKYGTSPGRIWVERYDIPHCSKLHQRTSEIFTTSL